jgi:hypothetical protein
MVATVRAELLIFQIRTLAFLNLTSLKSRIKRNSRKIILFFSQEVRRLLNTLHPKIYSRRWKINLSELAKIANSERRGVPKDQRSSKDL